jgi:2-phosphoglycerate kinase
MNAPYIILIDGATGVGSSAVASKLSEIYPVRGFQRTDSIRQVIRTILSPLLCPEIFQSTYKAYENIDSLYYDSKIMSLDKVIFGHLKQSELVFLGIDGTISRDIKESINSIYEGVHLLPGKLKEPDWYANPIRIKMIESLKDFGVELLSQEDYAEHIIEILIDIEDPEIHKQRFITREKYSPNRPSKKYLDNFSKIRLIRDYTFNLAEKNEIRIIQNIDLDEAVAQCKDEIAKKTEGKFF